MFLTQTNVIRGLTKSEYAMLGEMCRYANNLYNVACTISDSITSIQKRSCVTSRTITNARLMRTMAFYRLE